MKQQPETAPPEPSNKSHRSSVVHTQHSSDPTGSATVARYEIFWYILVLSAYWIILVDVQKALCTSLRIFVHGSGAVTSRLCDHMPRRHTMPATEHIKASPLCLAALSWLNWSVIDQGDPKTELPSPCDAVGKRHGGNSLSCHQRKAPKQAQVHFGQRSKYRKLF